MRWLLLLPLLALGAAGCRDDGDGGGRWFSRAARAESSVGDASLGPSGRLQFEVSSGVYRRWKAAQQALGKSAIARSIAQLGRRALKQQELDDAVARVEGDARARQAIEGAGMTAREYVYATVAIEQAMAVASGRLAPLENDTDVPPQNVEIVGRYRDEILSGGMIGDTVYLPPAPDSFAIMPPTPASDSPLPTLRRPPGADTVPPGSARSATTAPAPSRIPAPTRRDTIVPPAPVVPPSPAPDTARPARVPDPQPAPATTPASPRSDPSRARGLEMGGAHGR